MIDDGLSHEELLELSGAFEADSDLMPVCQMVLRKRGKQLRPRLVFAAARLGSAPDNAAVHRAAAAVELFHCASLAHDDVVDDATLRRGEPTVGASHGNTGAVLSGGWLFARAASLASTCNEGAAARFADASCEVCDGQMQEFLDLYNAERSQSRYFGAIKGKTAALFELSARLGAECAATDSDGIRAASRFGSALGMAFQIIDDLQDLVLSEDLTGKPRGNDLLHGVYTLPVLYALEKRPEIAAHLSQRLSPDDLDPLVALLAETDGPSKAVEDAVRYAELAQEAIADRPGADGLEQLLVDAVAKPLKEVQGS
jgi:heptaprenyl diphosphate synthase